MTMKLNEVRAGAVSFRRYHWRDGRRFQDWAEGEQMLQALGADAVGDGRVVHGEAFPEKDTAPGTYGVHDISSGDP
jgi:hypothetical protein